MPWYVWIIIVVVGLVFVWLLGRKLFGYFGWLPPSVRGPTATLSVKDIEAERAKIAEDFQIIEAKIKKDMDEIRRKLAEDVKRIEDKWTIPN
jgi:hypothetical protein